MLRGYPYDHPFHNGIVVAQRRQPRRQLLGDAAEAIPPEDVVFANIGCVATGEVSVALSEDHVVITQYGVWRGD